MLLSKLVVAVGKVFASMDADKGRIRVPDSDLICVDLRSSLP
jgi:hypothetical protein